jgi:hypothetical protein
LKAYLKEKKRQTNLSLNEKDCSQLEPPNSNTKRQEQHIVGQPLIPEVEASMSEISNPTMEKEESSEEDEVEETVVQKKQTHSLLSKKSRPQDRPRGNYAKRQGLHVIPEVEAAMPDISENQTDESSEEEEILGNVLPKLPMPIKFMNKELTRKALVNLVRFHWYKEKDQVIKLAVH